MKAVVNKEVVRDVREPAERGSKGPVTLVHLIGNMHVGGAEQQLVSLVPLFDKSRFRVKVITMQPGGRLLDALEKTGIGYECINFRIRTFIPSLLRLVKILKRERTCILHTHMTYPSFFGRLGGLCARVPVMITTDHGQERGKKRWEILFDRLFNRFTAARVGVTSDVAEIIHTRDHTPKSKVIVIQNGVDTERFRVDKSEGMRVRRELGLPDDAIVVGTVARLTWEKALDVLIEAVSELVKTIPQLRCIIVGDGSLREELAQCVKSSGMQNHVLLTGTRLDVPDMMSAFDIFALSSKSEGLPVSILEAMSAGKPIVSTNVGGIPEVITDRSEALLVEPGSPQALAAGIAEVIADPQLASDLVRNASAKVIAQYSVAATARKLEDVYSKAVSGRPVT